MGTLILEHFFGKLRQPCKVQHVETQLRRIQDLTILELILDKKQENKIPKQNFDKLGFILDSQYNEDN